MSGVATRSILAALAATLFLLAGTAGAEPIGDWTLKDVDGRDVTISKAAAQKTQILFFWATWCPYCKALMPHLQSIVDEYGRKDVEILAITIKEDGKPAAVLEQQGYQFRLLPDGDAIAERYGITGTPGVLILDKNASVIFDLRDATSPREREIHKNMSDAEKAGRRAPYWAARIRRALDERQ